ncbi:MAG TPA: hypothetical protein VFJ96_07910, partial [Gemmatimonadaceae bacterium]|nr:hypothetical protein [Gemmatimonadaceae bacterium]
MTIGARRTALHVIARASLVAGLALAVACTSHENGESSARTPSVSTPATPGLPHPPSDSARAAIVAESIATARDQWNAAEIAKRLTEAGLVVTDKKKTVHYPGLQQPGELLDVSGNEMQIYVYDDEDARRRDSKNLDTTNAGTAALGAPLRPHFIITNNLVALLFTQRGALAERVDNALMARHL